VPLRTKDLKQFRPSRVDLQAVKKDLVIPKRQSAAARTCSVPSTVSQAADLHVVPSQKSRSEISIAPQEKLKLPVAHYASTLGIGNKNQTSSTEVGKPTDSFQDIPLTDEVILSNPSPAVPLSHRTSAEQRQSIALEDTPLRSLEEGTIQQNALWSQQKSKSAAQILTSRVSDSVNQLTRTVRSQLNNNDF